MFISLRNDQVMHAHFVSLDGPKPQIGAQSGEVILPTSAIFDSRTTYKNKTRNCSGNAQELGGRILWPISAAAAPPCPIFL
jgi:hypothetical protein